MSLCGAVGAMGQSCRPSAPPILVGGGVSMGQPLHPTLNPIFLSLCRAVGAMGQLLDPLILVGGELWGSPPPH